MRWRCPDRGAEEGANRRSETREGEFAESVCLGELQVQTHFGNGAQRSEREVGGGGMRTDIMAVDSVQGDRSKREFRCGTGDMLAKPMRATEGLGLVVRLMKLGRVLSPEGVVGAREPAWISKTG